MKRSLSQAKLQKQVDDFNARFPLGAPVMLQKDFAPAPILTKVRHPAYVLSGHSAVAFFEGITGCYLVDRASAPTKEQLAVGGAA